MTNNDHLDDWYEPLRSAQETYEEKLDRWKEEWNRELDDDLANGR